MKKRYAPKDCQYRRALELRQQNISKANMASARQLGRRATLRKLGKKLSDIYRYKDEE